MGGMEPSRRQKTDQPASAPDIGYDPSKPVMTLGDLLDSPLVGLWDDDDGRDSSEIARELRERGNRRDR
jgi:hypothetical protein